MEPIKGVLSSDAKDTNPGAPFRGKGPDHPPHPLGHLRLPSGETISNTNNDQLRAWMTKLQIPGAQSDGRSTLIEKYAAAQQAVFNSAGQKAVADWLLSQSKKG